MHRILFALSVALVLVGSGAPLTVVYQELRGLAWLTPCIAAFSAPTHGEADESLSSLDVRTPSA